jgi:acetyl esterase/lipase
MKEWFVSELEESLGSSAHDVQLILDYLGSRADLDASRVGMFGQGSGASIAILSAAADPRIRALDLLNPWGDWPEWLKDSPVVPDAERAHYLTPEFLSRTAVLDPVRYLPQLAGRALRVQQVMDDPDTPAAAKDRIAAAVPGDGLARFKDTAAHKEAWKVTGLSGWIAARFAPSRQETNAATGGNK